MPIAVSFRRLHKRIYGHVDLVAVTAAYTGSGRGDGGRSERDFGTAISSATADMVLGHKPQETQIHHIGLCGRIRLWNHGPRPISAVTSIMACHNTRYLI
jgi:hypothetical protein